jgi:hypothetical protein
MCKYMSIYILFWVNHFYWLIPYVDVLKYENVKTKHLVHIFFKINMKAKTYGIKF